MNGSKSTFKRKGYWLTAFAAAVLLAASPGRRRRRSKSRGPPDEVAEGGMPRIRCPSKGYIEGTTHGSKTEPSP